MRRKDKKAQPEVGIIFFVPRSRPDGGNLFIERTPLPDAPSYGDFLIHENGHDNYWDQLVHNKAVPAFEYDEVPRARVVYDKSKKQFTLLGDRCILDRPKLVKRILQCMHLPRTTILQTDSHYVCPGCGRRKRGAANSP